LPYEWVTQIGHIAMLDTYVKIQHLGWRPSANLLLLAPAGKVANAAYLDYWRKYLIVVSDNELVQELFQYQRYIGDCFNAFLYDDERGASWPDVGAKAHIEWDLQGREPLLKLTERDQQRGRDTLIRLGMPPAAWFAGLHAREGGFHRETMSSIQGHRNATINDYLPAIQRVVEAGGWVVRMGDKTMTPLPPMSGVIDYAHSDVKNDWMDVYIAGAARFFIGTTSGLTNAIISFGTPCLLINCVTNFSQLWNNKVRFMLKLLWSRRENRHLTLREITNDPIRSSIFNVNALDKLGIEIINNSPLEIDDAVEEMLRYLAKPDIDPNEWLQEWNQVMNGNAMWGNGVPLSSFIANNRSALL
jgi:putative glycosyltransferase (TIGR04372 family)